jgi:hypothetical protein
MTAIVFLVALILGIVGTVMLFGQTTTVTRTWTAPGDPKPDGTLKPVFGYWLCWSTDSAAFWNDPLTGTRVPPSLVAPKAPGLVETVLVAGIPDDRRVYWRLRSTDAAGNWSAWSNRFNETTPDHTGPVAVPDLK